MLPDLVLFYAEFNATEMRAALDAPELDYAWVRAHEEDEEQLRKEEEEEAAEEAAEKVLFHIERASSPRAAVRMHICRVHDARTFASRTLSSRCHLPWS